MHWTESQRWQNVKTSETISAGALIARYDRYLRVNRVSLCCATFDVRMSDDSVWRRQRDDVDRATR